MEQGKREKKTKLGGRLNESRGNSNEEKKKQEEGKREKEIKRG